MPYTALSYAIAAPLWRRHTGGHFMQTVSATVAANGTQLCYELGGDGPVVTLLHGFSLDSRMWDQQFAPFAREYRVLRYDLRGFGRSGGVGEESYSPADDLAALLDHLGIATTAVIGLSMGGGFAIDFALAYPQRTTALVAADSALAGYDWTAGRPSAWHSKLAATHGVDAAKRAWLECPLFQPAAEKPDVAAALRRCVDAYSGWHWLNENPLIAPQAPAIGRLAEISCPSLILVGERDTADFHAIAERLAEDIPEATLTRIPGAGHMSNMEAPKAFNAAVLNFLRASTTSA